MTWFFNEPNHAWMNNSRYTKAHLYDFFENLPIKMINTLFANQDIYFVLSSGKFSCSVTNSNEQIIIVFPELRRLLNAPFDGYAKAIIAHELGHIYMKHSQKRIDPLEAQIEADSFAIELGYADQIASFLEEQPESLEKRVRLTYCTSHIMSYDH